MNLTQHAAPDMGKLYIPGRGLLWGCCDMGDQGAITQAVEALEDTQIELRFWHRNSKEVIKSSSALQQSEEALEALKAFKDGVPEGLESAVDTGRRAEIGQAAKDTSTWLTAAKHLQEGIK